MFYFLPRLRESDCAPAFGYASQIAELVNKIPVSLRRHPEVKGLPLSRKGFW
jgi:hypothetical protein